MKTKTCLKCKETKSIEEFGKSTASIDNLNRYCKLCVREMSKKNYYKNLEKTRESKKRWNRKYYNTPLGKLRNNLESKIYRAKTSIKKNLELNNIEKIKYQTERLQNLLIEKEKLVTNNKITNIDNEIKTINSDINNINTEINTIRTNNNVDKIKVIKLDKTNNTKRKENIFDKIKVFINR